MLCIGFWKSGPKKFSSCTLASWRGGGAGGYRVALRAGCKHFVLLVQPEASLPLEVTVAPQMCVHNAELPFASWLLQRVNPTTPGQVGNSLGQTSFCPHRGLAWWPEKCGWGRAVSEASGREAGWPCVGRAYAVIKGEEFGRSGLHYSASGVGEAECPFGSRRLSSCCFLVWIWLRLRKVIIVLWIRRGQGTQNELASETPSWGRSGGWRGPSLSCWAVTTELPGTGGNGHRDPLFKHTHRPMDCTQGRASTEASNRTTEKGRNWYFSWETVPGLCIYFLSSQNKCVQWVLFCPFIIWRERGLEPTFKPMSLEIKRAQLVKQLLVGTFSELIQAWKLKSPIEEQSLWLCGFMITHFHIGWE